MSYKGFLGWAEDVSGRCQGENDVAQSIPRLSRRGTRVHTDAVHLSTWNLPPSCSHHHVTIHASVASKVRPSVVLALTPNSSPPILRPNPQLRVCARLATDAADTNHCTELAVLPCGRRATCSIEYSVCSTAVVLHIS